MSSSSARRRLRRENVIDFRPLPATTTPGAVGVTSTEWSAIVDNECHRCRVRRPSLSSGSCMCNDPQPDFHVETDPAALLDNDGDEDTAIGDTERELHLAAAHAVLDELERRGHSAEKISRTRSELRRQQEQFGLVDVHPQQRIGAATASPSDPLRVDGGDRDSLRKFIIETIQQERNRQFSTRENFQKELNLERGAFKILVRSSTPSPINPKQMISSSRSSGSGFLVDFDTLPILGDNGAVIDQRPKKTDSESNDNEYIVTNGHVVRNADSIAVVSALFPTMPMAARVVSVSFDLDLAFLEVVERDKWRRDKFVPFTLCADQVRFIQRLDEVANGHCGFARLQSVFAIGYPLGAPRVQITKGNVSGFQRISDEPVIQITAPINPGSSGGSLVNQNGEVLGITSSGIPSAELTGFSIPVQYIFNLKEVVNKADEFTRVIEIPYFGAELVGADTYARFLPDFDQRRDTLIIETDDETGALKNVVRKRFAKEDQQRTGVLIVKLDPISILTRPISTIGRDDNVVLPRIFDMISEFAGFELDNDGLTRGETYPRKMSLRDLFRTLPFNKRFRVTFYRGREAYTNEYLFLPKPVNALKQGEEYAVRSRSKERDESVPMFRLPGQVVFSELTLDFIEVARRRLPHLSFYSLPENRTKTLVVVLGDQSDALDAGDIIVRIGDVDVKSVADIAATIFARPGQYIRVEAASGRSTLLFSDPMLAMAMKMMGNRSADEQQE